MDLKSASEAEDEDDEEEEEEEEPESDDGAAGWAIVKKTLDAVKKPTPLPPPKPIEYYDGSTEGSPIHLSVSFFHSNTIIRVRRRRRACCATSIR